MVAPAAGPGLGAAQGQGTGAVIPQGTGVPAAGTSLVPATSTGVPGSDPMSSCWCGCEADCPYPCDLCSTSPVNNYSYNSNNNGNENIIGSLQPANTG